MHFFFVCLTLFENKGPFLSISDTDVLFCQSDQNDWYKFGFFAFCFSAEKDMILLGILASTPVSDCEMTCLGLIWWLWRWMWTEHQIMFLQYWQIFLCENWTLTLRLPMANVCAWWISGNCVGVRGVFQWLDVSVQIVPSGSCKLENSFFHGLILSTTEVGFFIWMTQMF